jgi:antitoxin CptB
MGEHDRVRWRCRRGLLELDLVLQGFLERRFEGLDAGEKDRFNELLDFPDNDLLDLALGRAEPADPRYRDVVRLLRAG